MVVTASSSRAPALAVEIPLLAAATWVVLFWWLRLVPIPWEPVAFAIGVASFGGGLWVSRRPLDPASILVWAAAAFFLSSLIARALSRTGFYD